MKIYCAPRGARPGSEAAYSLLERLISDVYGCALPEIKKTPNGKPYFPARPDIYFSLSHSRTHVLCAVSGSPVGVDIESPREISERVVKYFCSPEELAFFYPLELWVLKESCIKLMGATLPLVKRLRFSLDGDRIVAQDEIVTAKLYNIDSCIAAASSLTDDLPVNIELGALDKTPAII